MTDLTCKAINSTDMSGMFGIGLLGATSPISHGIPGIQEARLAMIERRILRIEMALRRAGIEVENLELGR